MTKALVLSLEKLIMDHFAPDEISRPVVSNPRPAALSSAARELISKTKNKTKQKTKNIKLKNNIIPKKCKNINIYKRFKLKIFTFKKPKLLFIIYSMYKTEQHRIVSCASGNTI